MTAVLILVVGIVLLGLGYIVYGSWLAKKWGVNPDRPTPAHTKFDNKDFVPANPAVLMGHHFSSIAGAGPINGPIQAAVFGWLPVFLWVVIGGIFFGAMHDFGALFASIRHGGRSIGEVIKDNIGPKAYKLFVIFALLVLILVIASFTSVVASTFQSTVDANGNPYDFITVGMDNASGNASTATTSLLFIVIAVIFGYFVYRRGAKVGPATVIGVIGIIVITFIGLNVGINLPRTPWIIFIAVYITLASLLPVWILLQPRDYLSSFLLYGMMILALVGVLGGSWNSEFELEAFTGWESSSGYLFPTLFITVACGAISGFHATQSPMMARCITNEYQGRKVFYGAMVAEGVIAMIWAAAGVSVYNGTQGLWDATTSLAGQSALVYDICIRVLGPVGGVLAMIGVIVCPITSGDTAFRSARLTLADWFDIDQKPRVKRLLLSVPLLLCGALLSNMNFQVIWRYFSWSNQTLAMIALWAAAVFLCKARHNFWPLAIPATFMSAVSSTYILVAPEGFGPAISRMVSGEALTGAAALKAASAVGYPAGIAFATLCFAAFWFKCVRPNAAK